MVVSGSPVWSNACSWWSWLVPYVCEGLRATGVKADGRLTLCMAFAGKGGGSLSLWVNSPVLFVNSFLNLLVAVLGPL